MNKTQPLAADLGAAKSLVRDVPDFPKKGILFRDVTPLLKHGPSLAAITRALADSWRGRVDVIAGMESRGFIFGAALAVELGVGFIPVRKSGKLPYKTESMRYGLEYGHDTLEIHVDACASGDAPAGSWLPANSAAPASPRSASVSSPSSRASASLSFSSTGAGALAGCQST